MKNFKFFPANVPIGATAQGETVFASPEFLRALTLVKESLDGIDVPFIQAQSPVETFSEPVFQQSVPDALPAVQVLPQSGLETAWPVGSVFVSAVATDPATMLGFGSWTAIGAGKFPVAFLAGDPDFGTLLGTGGAKTKAISAHAGTAVADHADHTHAFTSSSNAATPDLLTENLTGAGVAASGITGGASGGFTHAVTQPSAHTDLNVLPPYFALNFWQRTA